MPSVISLRDQEYYANSQNSFWWIMGELCSFSISDSYAARVKSLTQKGFAVWDVLFDCVRPGSADSDIERGSERINNFSRFFEENPTIKLIAFNGNAARQIFMRHCGDSFLSSRDIASCQLPSSSPAYAAMRPQEKLLQWRAALNLA